MDTPRLAAFGAVGAAIGSALCCAGPLVAVVLGVSGAGLAATFEPLRSYFLAATGALLALGFYLLGREERRACEPGKACADLSLRRRMRRTLWVATALAVLLAHLPDVVGLDSLGKEVRDDVEVRLDRRRGVARRGGMVLQPPA